MQCGDDCVRMCGHVHAYSRDCTCVCVERASLIQSLYHRRKSCHPKTCTPLALILFRHLVGKLDKKRRDERDLVDLRATSPPPGAPATPLCARRHEEQEVLPTSDALSAPSTEKGEGLRTATSGTMPVAPAAIQPRGAPSRPERATGRGIARPAPRAPVERAESRIPLSC